MAIAPPPGILYRYLLGAMQQGQVTMTVRLLAVPQEADQSTTTRTPRRPRSCSSPMGRSASSGSVRAWTRCWPTRSE